MMTSDIALLEQYAKDQQQGAFAELVRRHLSGVYSAALRRVGGDAHAAEDVAQRVFVALARKAPSISRHPCLTGWLYTATRHEAAKLVRGEQRRKAREALAEPPQEPEGVEWEQISPMLDEALDRLGSLDRDLILLRVIDHLSYQQLGERFHLSEDAARMRLSRAMDKLRGILARSGIASTASVLESTLAQHAAAAVPAGVAGNVVHATLAAMPGVGAAAGLGAALAGVLLSPTSALVAVGILSFAAAGYEFDQQRRASLGRARAQVDYDSAMAAYHSNQKAAAASNAEVVASADRAAGEPKPVATAEPSDPVAAGDAFMRRHPEVKDVLLEYLNDGILTRYRALFRQLNLSPDQIAQFETLLRGDWNTFGRVLENGTIKISTDDPKLTSEQITAGLQSVLGPAGYNAYTVYSGSLYSREFVTYFGSLLATSAEPLTTAQAQQFLDLFQQANGISDHARREAVLGQAQSFLSADQYQTMQQLRVYQRASMHP